MPGAGTVRLRATATGSPEREGKRGRNCCQEGPGVIRMVRKHRPTSDRGLAEEVWEPGAGVEATGGHCPGLNGTGVACRPSTPPGDAGAAR